MFHKIFNLVMSKFSIILCFFVFFVSGVSTYAQVKAKQPKAEELVKITLLTDHKQVLPGTPFLLGVKFTIEKDWHTYWLNPGDAGLSPEFDLELPVGWKSMGPMFPTPKKFPFDDFANYGYDKEVIHFIPIVLPPDVPLGNYSIKVKTSYLVCKEECIPGKDSSAINITVSHLHEIDTKAMTQFTPHVEQLPLRNVEVSAYATYRDETIIISFKGEQLNFSGNLTFFPIDEGYMLNGAKQKITQKGDLISLELPLDRFREETPNVISGLIVSDKAITNERNSRSLMISNIHVIK